MPHVTSIGLDVHARSVAAAAFNPFTGEVVHRDFGTDAAEIAEWALGFEEPRACYESGPTGFHMARELRALGLDCAVAAVSKMQRPAADARRKNDRRDAEFIARMLATHNIVEVPLPDAAVEAARDLDRALDDATAEYRRARQRLNMFLIRLGHVWDERNADGTRKGSWTRAHWRWISGIRLEGPQRDVLEYYVTAARCAESDRRQLEKKVLALARTDRWRPVVEALSCIKGIDTLTAFRLAAEAGSFTRFRTAPAFASWCGLVPSERSSGETERRGGITKTGNRLARTALVESAWHYLTCTPRPKAPAPGADVAAAIRARADACTARLCRRREALAAAGKSSCKANAAVARELACWVWEIGRRAEGTLGWPRRTTSLPPGGPAPRRIAGARSRALFGQPKGRAREQDWFRTSAPDGESKCGGVCGHAGLTAGSAPARARGY